MTNAGNEGATRKDAPAFEPDPQRQPPWDREATTPRMPAQRSLTTSRKT